jgi:hypothetical protein
MLAYLDGILEPEDTQDIGKKIEDSQYASGLLHRIRDVMRKLRLAAPSVNERGPGLDANTVAEYLDNTLPGERVPDFEKVCLESDVHLAEVASCHQVLAAVLGEPAEIDPESRQRMYQLPQLAAQAAAESRGDYAAAAAGDGNAAASDAAMFKARPKPTVPEYLRERPKGRRLLTTSVLLLLAGVFAGTVLWVMGLFEPGTPLGNFLRTGRWNNQIAAAPDTATKEQSPEKAGWPDKAPATSPAAKETPTVTPTATATEIPKVAKPTTPEPATKPGKAKTEPGPGETKPPTVPEHATAEGIAKPPVAPLPEPGVQPKAIIAGEPGKPAPLPPPTALAKGDVKLPAVPGAAESHPPAAPGAESAKPVPAAPATPQRLGQFLSGDQVLLQYDQSAGYWKRLPAKEMVVSAQRLLALPTYRDEIALNAGITLQLLGGTQVQLLHSIGSEPAGLDVAFGRIVLAPVRPGPQLHLTIGNLSGVLTLVDAETIAAIEVIRVHTPGVNPESETLRTTADLYVTHGTVLWQEKSAKKPVRIAVPARLALDVQLPPDPQPLDEKDLPKWIVLESPGPLEQRASAVVAQSLQYSHSANDGLKELAYHRQKEVAWLAQRCLGYVCEFDPMVTAINNPSHKTEWPEYVEELRSAIARGPEYSAAISQSLETKYGQESKGLYRMLWGYTDKNLQDGEDRTLVQMLEHETLAFRVLAFWNLKDITGLGLHYRPEQTLAQRRQPIIYWKQRQKSGEIRIRSSDEKSHIAPEAAPLPPPPPPAAN